MLTDAALEGKIDRLNGLKENVIIGKLIPAATGLKRYRRIEIEPAEPLPRVIDDVGLLDQDEIAAELGLSVGDELDGGYGQEFDADLASLEKIGAGGTDPGFAEELAELEVPEEPQLPTRSKKHSRRGARPFAPPGVYSRRWVIAALTRRSLLGSRRRLPGGARPRSPASSAPAPRRRARGPGGRALQRAVRAGRLVREHALGLLGPGLHTSRSGLGGPAGAGLATSRPGARPELRFQTPDGCLQPWGRPAPAGHEDSLCTPAGVLGEPLVDRGHEAGPLRSAHAARGARLYTVDVSGGAGAARLVATRAARRERRRGAAGRARARRRAGTAADHRPRVLGPRALPAEPGPRIRGGGTRLRAPHRRPNGYSHGEVPAMLRAIYVFHRQVRGWHDIGYNFALDRFGRVFEARAGGIDEAVVGAHAGGYNAVLHRRGGDRQLHGPSDLALPPERALSSCCRGSSRCTASGSSAAWSVTVDPAGAAYSRFRAGSEVTLPRIAGHRDADSTDCPGDALYGELPAIRTRAHALAGTPSRPRSRPGRGAVRHAHAARRHPPGRASR